jgi:hypothetical protein
LSSRYDFHLVRLTSGTPDWAPDTRLIPAGISKSISYWDNQPYRQLSYDGPLWELDPVEVRARPRPQRHANPLPAIETALLRNELGGDAAIDRLRAFLVERDLALIVSRDVTRRADRQQDFNLKIAGSATQTALPGATPIEIAYMQLFQGDLIRGYSQFHAGRRPLAQHMHDGLLPPLSGAPPASVRLAADGSMAALVPAGRALTWQLVAEDGAPVVRERYWVTFAAGEMRVCTNCHGINTTDVVLNQPPPSNPPEALRELARWWQRTYDGGAATPAATATATPVPPTATRTPTAAPPATVSGHVRYYRDDRPVPAVVVHGGTASDGGGAYAMAAPVDADLLLSPARNGGSGNAVSALDAAYALQSGVGQRALDADQRLACDVTGNGTVSALDAARILQRVIGLLDRLPVADACASDFAFVPSPAQLPDQRLVMPLPGAASCQPGVIALEPLAGPAAGQDFRAIAFGDCTGNWQPPAAALGASRGAPSVRIGPARASRRRELRVPIAFAAPGASQALELELRFDPQRLRFKRVRSLGPRAGLLVRAAAIEPGVVRIAAASATTFTGVRLVALFAPRVAGVSAADFSAGAVVVDERPARAVVVGR